MSTHSIGKIKPKTSFQQSRTIGSIYYGGPAVVTDDGSKLFTVEDVEEGGVLATCMRTGDEISRFDTESSVSAMCCIHDPTNPSQGYLVLCLRSFSIQIYDLSVFEMSQPVRIFPTFSIAKAHDAPMTICTSSSRKNVANLFATGAADGIVKVWDASRGVCTHVFKNHGGVVSALSFFFPQSNVKSDSTRGTKDTKKKQDEPSSSSGAYLLTGCTDSKVRVFNLVDRSVVWTLDGHSSVIRGLDVLPAPDNTKNVKKKSSSSEHPYKDYLIVSGGRDRVINVWSMDTGQVLQTIIVMETIEAIGIMNVTGSPVIYSGGEQGRVRLWSISTGNEVTPPPPTDPSVASDSSAVLPSFVDVLHLPRISTLIAFTVDQTIVSYSIPTLEVTKQIVGSNDEVVDTVLLSAPYSLDDNESSITDSHLAVASNSAAIRLYSLMDNTFDTRLLVGHTDIILSLSSGYISSESDSVKSTKSVLISGSKDNTARIWVPVLFKTCDGSKWVWKCVGTCTGHMETIGATCLPQKYSTHSSPPPIALTASSDQTLKIWDLQSLPSYNYESDENDQDTAPTKISAIYTQKIHNKDINSIDISPDYNLIATGSQDKTCKLFSLDYSPSTKSRAVSAVLKLSMVLAGHKRGVWSVKFSHKDRLLATGSGDQSIKLWDVTNGQCLKTFEGHTNTVLRVNFINYGTQLVSSASDGLVKVWNIKEEDCAATMDGHEDKVWALTVSSDEKRVFSGATDSNIIVWQDITEEEESKRIQEAKELVSKNQDIDNLENSKDYRSAILLSLEIEQPRRLLQLFTKVARHDVDIQEYLSGKDRSESVSISGLPEVDEAIASLSKTNIVRLLEYVKDWNTTIKTADIAQRVLHIVLQSFPASALLKLGDTDATEEDAEKGDAEEQQQQLTQWKSRKQQDGARGRIAELLEALLAYTERHYARTDRICSSQSFVLDYTLSQMLDGMDEDLAF